MVITEIKLENPQQVAKEIESRGGKAPPIRTDLTSEADARDVVEKTIFRRLARYVAAQTWGNAAFTALIDAPDGQKVEELQKTPGIVRVQF